MTRLLLLLVLVIAGCASDPDAPLEGGAGKARPPGAKGRETCVGLWRAADAELGTLWLEVQDDDDCVLTGVDGQRFEFEADSEEGGLVARVEVGNPGLKILFGPEGTEEVEGTINFAMGFAEARFQPAGPDKLDVTFWRRSRPAETKKTVRMSRPPAGERPPAGP